LRKLQLSNTSDLLCSLKEVITHNPESRFLHRLHCVLLVAQGCSCYRIAEWFGENPRTIERWVHYAQEFGIEGLKDDQKAGRPSKVRDDHITQLRIDILRNPMELGYNRSAWDGNILRVHLEQCYEIELGIRQCQRLLHRLQNSIHSHELME
jgi:transposase